MSRLIYFALSRVLYAAGLCICLCSSALAQNDWRPPVSGWWAIGPVIHGDMTAAADYACRDTLGLHHLDNNSIYCKVYQTASHPEYGTVPLYMGIVKHVSACADTETPGSYDPAKKCYVAGEKPPVCDCVGNPVKFANGEKIQVERDYVAPTGLEFTRYYSNKLVGDQGALNAGWRHGYAKKLLLYQYNPNQLASYTWTAYPGGAGRWSGPWGGMPEAAGAYHGVFLGGGMKRILIFAGIIILLVAMIISTRRGPKDMFLVAQERVAIYESSVDALRQPSAAAKNWISPTEKVEVWECVDVKHYQIYRIRRSDGSVGYVNDGKYQLIRKGQPATC